MLESQIEAAINRALKRLGWISIKLTSSKGIPDRLIISPQGRCVFVEIKSERGKVKPHQEKWHKDLRKNLCEVIVVRSKAELIEWIAKN